MADRDIPEEPRFGDRVENPNTTDGDPRRVGIFVRCVARSRHARAGKRGPYFEVTDGNGDFWTVPAGAPGLRIIAQPDQKPDRDIPEDWQQQLSEVASFGRFESVARLVNGWRAPDRPGRDIPEEMVEKAARELYGGPVHRFKADGDDLIEYTVTWDEVVEKVGEQERDAFLRQARRILSAALAGRTEAPAVEQHDDDGTALRLARGRQWIAHQAGQRSGMPIPAWDDLTPAEQAQVETEARHWLRAAYNTGVTIVPPGRTVVDLPEPDGTSYEDEPTWSAHVDTEDTIFACVENGRPYVVAPIGDEPLSTDTAELFGLRLIAAARMARLRASGSGVGDQT